MAGGRRRRQGAPASRQRRTSLRRCSVELAGSSMLQARTAQPRQGPLERGEAVQHSEPQPTLPGHPGPPAELSTVNQPGQRGVNQSGRRTAPHGLGQARRAGGLVKGGQSVCVAVVQQEGAHHLVHAATGQLHPGGGAVKTGRGEQAAAQQPPHLSPAAAALPQPHPIPCHAPRPRAPHLPTASCSCAAWSLINPSTSNWKGRAPKLTWMRSFLLQAWAKAPGEGRERVLLPSIL